MPVHGPGSGVRRRHPIQWGWTVPGLVVRVEFARAHLVYGEFAVS
jgi:hypothetical protein